MQQVGGVVVVKRGGTLILTPRYVLLVHKFNTRIKNHFKSCFSEADFFSVDSWFSHDWSSESTFRIKKKFCSDAAYLIQLPFLNFFNMQPPPHTRQKKNHCDTPTQAKFQ